MGLLSETVLALSQRRDATRVIYDILSLARNRISKTQIVSRANLNFQLTGRYIRFLLAKGLIKENFASRGFIAYDLTDRGERLRSLLNSVEDELFAPVIMFSDVNSGTKWESSPKISLTTDRILTR